MPGHLKIRNGERKWVLKRAMRGVLPERILHAQEGRLQHPDEELAAARAAAVDALRCSRPNGSHRRGLFEPAEVDADGSIHTSPAARTTRTRLFPLMVLERWCEEHLR